MITIHLTGHLAKLVPNPDIKVEANSVAEAVSFLQQYDAFNPRKTNKKYTVEIPGFNSRDALFDRTDVTDIYISPLLAGAKQGGFLQIIIGIILIIVGLTVTFTNPLIGPMLVMNGALMILGGVIQLLTPQPKLPGMGSVGSEERSKFLGNITNTVAIGTQIPLLYGRRKWGGHYVSINIDAGEMNKAPESWYSSPFTDFGELTYSAAPETVGPAEGWTNVQPLIANYMSVTNQSGQIRLNFTPALTLASGQYDVMFDNGLAVSITNPSAGSVSYVVIPAGMPTNLPVAGTPIVFTRNYA